MGLLQGPNIGSPGHVSANPWWSNSDVLDNYPRFKLKVMKYQCLVIASLQNNNLSDFKYF